MSRDYRLAFVNRLFLSAGLNEVDAARATAATLPPTAVWASRGYRKAVRKAADRFAKKSRPLLRSGDLPRIREEAQATLLEYQILASTYGDSYLHDWAEYFLHPSDSQEGATDSTESLLERLLDPTASSDELWEAAGDQYESSTRAARVAGADWPEADEYGNPALRATVRVWRDEVEGWVSGSLEASLWPGTMTADPNPVFYVIGCDNETVFWGGHSMFLLPRPDVPAEDPVYEVRWADQQTHEMRSALLASSDSSLDLLRAFFDARWVGAEEDPLMADFLSPEPSVYPPR